MVGCSLVVNALSAPERDNAAGHRDRDRHLLAPQPNSQASGADTGGTHSLSGTPPLPPEIRMEAFAERARRELAATGERVQRRASVRPAS